MDGDIDGKIDRQMKGWVEDREING